MIPNELAVIACGMILSGMAAENLLAQRWAASGFRASFDTLAFLAITLTATGLVMLWSTIV